MLSANRFRSLRKMTMRDLLLKRGFSESGTMYVLHNPPQVFGVDFQASQSGGKYTINICFTFDFMPSCLSYKRKPFDEFRVLDFCLWRRLNNLRGQTREPWTPYGADDTECTNLLACRGGEALEEIAKLETKWREPGHFVGLLPPDLMRRYCEHLGMLSKLELPLFAEGPPFECDERALEILTRWEELESLFILLCFSALNIGNNGAVVEYADIAIRFLCEGNQDRKLRALLGRLKAKAK